MEFCVLSFTRPVLAHALESWKVRGWGGMRGQEVQRCMCVDETREDKTGITFEGMTA